MTPRSGPLTLGLAAVLLLLGPAVVVWGQPPAGGTPCLLSDPTCPQPIETRTAARPNACSDGYDNDGDNYQDGNGAAPAPGVRDNTDPDCLSELYCTDGYDNDGDGLIDLLANGAGGSTGPDPDCQCLAQANPGVDNCTANDFSIAFTADPTNTSDGCVNTSDTTTVDLTATFTAANADRPDVQLWVVREGVDAFSGTRCLRQILTPVNTTWPASPIPEGGPYPIKEAKTAEQDKCGDLGTQVVAAYRYPVPIPLPCSDLLPNGYVDLGQCGSWAQNDQSFCKRLTDAMPGAPSKCFCARNESTIPGPNLRTTCTGFSPPSGLTGGVLNPGETARFNLPITNTVTGCTSGAYAVGTNGELRCGTVSYVRVVIDYGAADDRGNFFYDPDTIPGNGDDVPVPLCPSTLIVPTNNGVLCNDSAYAGAGTGRLIWAPKDPTGGGAYTVLGAPASINLPFSYTLASGEPASLTFNATLWWDKTVDSGDAGIDISAAEAVDLTGAVAQPTSVWNCSTTFTATPISLASFAATESGRWVKLDWSTGTEVGNVGFNFWAETPAGRVRLNEKPVAGTLADTLEPKSYNATFARPEGAKSYFVEDLDYRGKGRLHGPFLAGQTYGEIPVKEPIDWASIRAESRRHEAERAAARRDRVAAISERQTDATALPIELQVTRDGLYRVTYEDLSAAGFDLRGVEVRGLALSSSGIPVPIYVSSGPRIGPGFFFEFFGRALDTLYTAENVYLLQTGVSRPARAAVDRSAPAAVRPAPAYLETRRFGENRDYALWSPLADPFFDSTLVSFGSPSTRSFSFAIDGLVEGAAASSTLTVQVYGATFFPGGPDHRVVIRLNGESLGEATFDDLDAHLFSASVRRGLLREGDNTLELELPGIPGIPVDVVSLEGWSVTYPRAFRAQADRLGFTADGARFEVAGLSSAQAVAYRMGEGSLVRLEGTTVQAIGDGSYTAVLPGSPKGQKEAAGAGVREYAVAGVEALQKPDIRAGRVPTDLGTGPATYLIVAHPSFLDGLGDLLAARRGQGHSVKVVDVEDVYAQYGHGIVDADAIRRYVADAARSLGTRYVLLVGGDTYDYRNHFGLSAVSFIPSLFVPTGDYVRYSPSDTAYADIDRDGVQDLAIGRLPVRSARELSDLLLKIQAYEAKAYGRTGVFAADVADSSASQPFESVSDQMIDLLPNGWTTERAYPGREPFADAKARLLAALDRGVALATWVGHSGILAWGSELAPQSLFTNQDAAALTNAGLPAVVAQWGCWNTYFVSPRSESLASKLLLSGDRGAAAVLGATTLTDDGAEALLARELAPRLTAPGVAMGDAILAAKRALAAEHPEMDDVLLGWNLLGDPAMKIDD